MTLVTDQGAADFIMTGEAQERKSGWSEGWLTTKKDNSTASVTVIAAATKDIVWAEEAGRPQPDDGWAVARWAAQGGLSHRRGQVQGFPEGPEVNGRA